MKKITLINLRFIINMSQQIALSEYLQKDAVQESIRSALGSRTQQFMTSVASLVTASPALAECERKSLISACMTAASLNLPINQNLGFAYIIPYNVKVKTIGEDGEDVWSTVKQAQFQMGYKGFIQLAQRSGMFKKLNATDVREGEISSLDRLTGDFIFNWIQDPIERNKKPVIGYIAFMELKNGFTKTTYMTVNELQKHAGKYSSSYKAKRKGNLWDDEFEVMALKTVIKLLISKYAPLNSELEVAILADQSVIDGDKYSYIDNKKITAAEIAQIKENEKIKVHIENAKTVAELEMCKEYIQNEELSSEYETKLKKLQDMEVAQ